MVSSESQGYRVVVVITAKEKRLVLEGRKSWA